MLLSLISELLEPAEQNLKLTEEPLSSSSPLSKQICAPGSVLEIYESTHNSQAVIVFQSGGKINLNITILLNLYLTGGPPGV